jgi:valyl-tRNA synthetase
MSEVHKTFQEKCRTGLHPFDRIMDGPSVLAQTPIVNWCPICGTVSVDLEVDGRVSPGYFLKARRPKILERRP